MTIHTIHTIQHVDYSRGDRVDHLFIVAEAFGPKPADTAVLLTVSDTGLDLVLDDQSAGWRDRPRTKGFSLTWDEVIARVVSGEFDHGTWSTDSDVPPGETTDSESTGDLQDEEHVSRCGYCGDVIDYCQGHGEDERAAAGFDYDSDEYDARREAFESVDESTEDPRLCDCGKGHWCPLWESWDGPGKTERDALCLEEIHEAIDEEERQDLLEEHGTVVVVMTEEEAEQLQDLLNTSPTLTEDHPALVHLDLGLGA
jgi:hypothetical protein